MALLSGLLMSLAVSEFQLLLTRLAVDLGIKVDRLLQRLDRLDERERLAFISDAYPELARAYLAAAMATTVQWYDEQPVATPKPGVAAFVAEAVDLIPDERLAASGRWALLQGKPVESLQGTAARAVFDQSRQTVLQNLAAEYGVSEAEIQAPGTRWARHASANACSFCKLMATRGAVYRSESSATKVRGRSLELTTADRRQLRQGQGFAPLSELDPAAVDEALERRSRYTNARAAKKAGKLVGDRKTGALRGSQKYGDKYHDWCHCTAVPVRPGGFYDPPPYVEQWERDYVEAVKAASAAGDTKGEYGAIDLKAVLNQMDRAARANQ